MRFLADENVSRLVADRLRDDGHDVAWIAEVSRGAADGVVLTKAEADSRILITEDRDFGELVIRQNLPVLGVLLLAVISPSWSRHGVVSVHSKRHERVGSR